VVTNLSTSRMIEEVANKYGQKVIRTSIGEGFVVDRALAEHAIMAGEGSGGVAILPTATTFDGFLVLAILLEAIATQNLGLGGLAGRLPRFFMRKGTLACPPAMVRPVMEGFREMFLDQVADSTDGVLMRWEDAWLHVRASNTEPLVRIIVEARDEKQAETLFENAMAQAQRMVNFRF